MKNMNELCDCCDSNNNIQVYDNSFFEKPILKCQNCTNYFVKDKEKIDLKKYYNKTYWNIFRNINKEKNISGKTDNAYFLKKFPKLIQIIVESTGIRKILAYSQYGYLKEFLKGKNLLEIGSGEGHILELFERKKFDVLGIEPSEKNVKMINDKLKNGICKQGFAEDEFEFTKQFDVIIMSHVLEHVIDCRKVIENLKKKLSNDGILFLEVPNCGSKKYLIESIETQPHIHHFTKKSLEKLLNILGFEIIKVDTLFGEIITFKDHLKYFLFWLVKKDYFYPILENEGKYLRIIAKKNDSYS